MMISPVRYDDVLRVVGESSATDWAVLTPVRIEAIDVSGENAPDVHIRGHEYLAHYKPDLHIGLAWGAPQRQWEGVWKTWSPFPDPEVYGEYAEILFDGRPVLRQLVVSADGGRYYLPAPHARTSEGQGRGEIVAWTVVGSEVPIARLIHELSGGGDDFEMGMQAAGFEVTDE